MNTTPSPFTTPINNGPYYQWAWDATALSALMKCPYSYYLRHRLGWRKTGNNAALNFGLWYHKGREIYERAAIAAPEDLNGAMVAALRAVLVLAGEEVSEQRWGACGFAEKGIGWEMCPRCASDDVETVSEWVSWHGGDNAYSAQTLARMLVWSEEGYEFPAQTLQNPDGTALVEYNFRYPLGGETPDGQPYTLCGYIDRIVQFGNETFVGEHKTTKTTLGGYYFDRYSPSVQISTYAAVADAVFPELRISGVLIEGAQTAVGFSRFMRAHIKRTREQNEAWLGETIPWWLRVAEQCAEIGYWPMNEASCFLCRFRDICEKSPSVREKFLPEKFEQEMWNPLEER